MTAETVPTTISTHSIIAKAKWRSGGRMYTMAIVASSATKHASGNHPRIRASLLNSVPIISEALKAPIDPATVYIFIKN